MLWTLEKMDAVHQSNGAMRLAIRHVLPRALLNLAALFAVSAFPVADLHAQNPTRNQAQYWGNSTAKWKQLVPPGLEAEMIAARRPIVPDDGVAAPRLLCWSNVGRAAEAKLTPDERVRLYRYIENGGIVVLASALPATLFAEDDVFDLQAGSAILGATRYDYADPAVSATPRLEQIVGDQRTLLDSYPTASGRHPGLGGLRTLQTLIGTEKVAKLGVNRVGKGALLYAAIIPGESEQYAALLRLLLARLLDPPSLESLFPLPSSNAAVQINGKIAHLAIADDGDSRKASDFLTDTLKQILGGRFFYPIPETNQLLVHVGRSAFVDAAAPDLDQMHPFGYVMKLIDGQHLILAGHQPQGTVYAVNDFLKRFAGYRKFAQGESFTILPTADSLKLPATLDVREQPDIDSYLLADSPNSDFGRNSRLTCQATHALDKLVPPAKYAATHPEYFPLINGKRKVMDPAGNNGPWNPCVAHPDLPSLARDYITEYFANNPTRFGLPLGVNDGGGDCQCPECVRYYAHHGNQYIGLYNTVARELAKTHPNKLVAFIAYSRTCGSVPHGVALDGNILVEITGMGRSAFAEMPRWRAAGARHIGLYDYLYTFGSGYVIPRYYPHFMATQWRRAYQEHHLRTIWAEYYPRSTVFSAPRQYVLDELAWNMDADVEALLDDHFAGMYGVAAAEVRALFDLFEKIYSRSPTADVPISGWKDAKQMEDYRWEDLEAIDAALQTARDVAASDSEPIVLRRMAELDAALALSRLHLTSYLCSRDLQALATVTSGEQIEKILALVVKGCDAVTALRSFALPDEIEQRLFCGNSSLAEFKAMSSLDPLPLLERQADLALDAASRFLERDGQDATSFWRTRLAAHGLEGIARTLVATQVHAGREPGENLVRNPSFEDIDQRDQETGIASDHLRFDKTPGWHTWTFPSSTSIFFRDSTLAADGKICAGIDENQIDSELISYVKLDANCRYRWSFCVRRNRGDEGFGMGKASVRMQDKRGWLDQGSAIRIAYPEACENNWIRLSTTFTTPNSDSITGLLLLGAARQAAGARTYFDDVRLVKIYDPTWETR